MKEVFKMKGRILLLTLSAVLAVTSFTACSKNDSKEKSDDGKVTITNVSYDPTRELYAAYN